MKKLTVYCILSLIIMFSFSSCGPSAEEVANETCDCFESIIGDKLFTESDFKFYKDSCGKLMQFKYNTDTDEKLRKELNLYEKQIYGSIEKVENAYNAQIEEVSGKIAGVYAGVTNSNWWISDHLYNNISDSVAGLIYNWYGVNVDNEVIKKALNSNIVDNSKSDFERKFNNQAKEFLNMMIVLEDEDKEYEKGERVLFHMYIGPKYKDNVVKTGEEFVNGYAVWLNTEKNYLIGHKVDEFWGEDKEFGSLKNYNSAIKKNNTYYIECFGLNTDLSNYIDSELLLIGNLVFETKQTKYNGYTAFTYYIARFENCELISVYDNQQITRVDIDAWMEYNKYLQSDKINMPDRNIEINKNSTNNVSNEKQDALDISNCNKFLNGYEKFMNEYIAAIKKFKKNPSDASIISDYTKMLQEASKWAAFDEECANDPKFVGKYTEIQMKIAQAASEL